MRTAYVIPGFRHSIGDEEYTWLIKHLKTLDYNVVPVSISWNNKVMTDYINQFIDAYEPSPGNVVIGFSFGAMIAGISSGITNPKELHLLSLSPYFKRDLTSLKPQWKKNIGSRRIEDFRNYQLHDVCAHLPENTHIYYGKEEGRLYPSLRATCEDASRLSSSKLHVVDEAPHSIKFPSYQEAIKANL